MELSFFTVSIVLTIIWGLAYIKLKNHLVTSKGYFFLLLLMALAGIVLPLNRYLDLGYDPIFMPNSSDITIAEMSEQDKNAISHRGRALRAMLEYIKENFDL